MTELEWLTSENPGAMLDYLTARPMQAAATSERSKRHPSERKLRLFVCASALHARCGLYDQRTMRAIDVAEKYADGEVTSKDRGLAFNATDNILSSVERLVARACLRSDKISGAYDTVTAYINSRQDGLVQTNLLRDIVGNPFEPKAYSEVKGKDRHYSWPDGKAVSIGEWNYLLKMGIIYRQEWSTSDVLGIAQKSYEGRDFAGLPVLADALEDVGCNSDGVLRHLRGYKRCTDCLERDFDANDWCTYCGRERWVEDWWRRTPSPSPPLRARGDWALDLILGKS